MEAEYAELRGQAFLEGRSDFLGSPSRQLPVWQQAAAMHDLVARPSAVPRDAPRATSVATLKHKVPKKARAANDRGLSFAQKGEHGKSSVEFDKAIALDPQFADAHNNLGVELMYLGRLAAAAQEFRRAVELDPAAAIAHVNLATIELLLGNLEEAQQLARRGIGLGDSSAHARYVLGASAR